MRLFLVRHGQTDWNVQKRAQGHTDIPLDATGREQAIRTGKAFLDLPIRRLLTSDLQRASQTADEIARNTKVPVEILPELRERGFGEWEGQPFAEIGIRFGFEADFKGVTRNEITPPGGESFVDVWNRVKSVVDDVQKRNIDTAIVAHGGTCSLLLAMFLNGDVSLSNAFRFSNACINELEPRPDGGLRLIRYNDVSHLAGIDVVSGVADGSR
ncbi:MAG: histidine phosphatase family protein [Armatimonadetes bacterium]|nr:histidine phosphatase family protein [Armatimonadota bacterium]